MSNKEIPPLSKDWEQPPSYKTKADESAEISAQTEEYIANGGEIEQVPTLTPEESARRALDKQVVVNRSNYRSKV